MSGTTTSIVAHHVAALDFASLPAAVRSQVRRVFLNWVGCALGGSAQPAVTTALAAVSEFAGPAEASILGRSERLDVLSTTLINCMSSAVLTFDDTHLPSITHPGGPVASAALAVAERKPVGGRELVTAVALGVEASCRLGGSRPRAPTRKVKKLKRLIGRSVVHGQHSGASPRRHAELSCQAVARSTCRFGRWFPAFEAGRTDHAQEFDSAATKLGRLAGRAFADLKNRLGDFFDLHVPQYSRVDSRCGELCKIAQRNLRSWCEACPSSIWMITPRTGAPAADAIRTSH